MLGGEVGHQRAYRTHARSYTRAHAGPVVDPQVARSATDSMPVSPGSPEAIFAELSALRKKYDDLVAYTVNLTGDRDYLNNELATVKYVRRGCVPKLAPPSAMTYATS